MYKGWIWLPKARKGDIRIGLNTCAEYTRLWEKETICNNGFECKGKFHWKQKSVKKQWQCHSLHPG